MEPFPKWNLVLFRPDLTSSKITKTKGDSSQLEILTNSLISIKMWTNPNIISALLFGLAPIAGWKIYPKVGQVNRFLEEKGDLRRDFQVRFYLNLPTSAVLEEEKMPFTCFKYFWNPSAMYYSSYQLIYMNCFLETFDLSQMLP